MQSISGVGLVFVSFKGVGRIHTPCAVSMRHTMYYINK